MGPLVSRIFGRSREAERVNGNGVSHVHVIPAGTQSTSTAGYVVTTAESAPCTCPDFCERDHGNE